MNKFTRTYDLETESGKGVHIQHWFDGLAQRECQFSERALRVISFVVVVFVHGQEQCVFF